MQRGALRDVPFLEVVLVLLDRHVQPPAGDDAALVHGEFVRVPEADHLVVDLEVGEVEGRDPSQRLDRRLEAPLQVGQQRLQGGRLGARWKPPTATLIGWMARRPGPSSNSLPIFFSRSPFSTASRWSAARLMPLS